MRQFFALILVVLVSHLRAQDVPPITIEVDARELPRKLPHTTIKTINIPYEGGVRYSDMTRAEGKPDVLAEILKGGK